MKTAIDGLFHQNNGAFKANCILSVILGLSQQLQLMFEAVGEQLQKRIFNSRNRKLKARPELRETFHTPFMQRIEQQLLINHRLSEGRFLSRHAGTLNLPFQTHNIILVAKKATRYNIQSKYSYGAIIANKQLVKGEQFDQPLERINGMIAEPIRYKSLLSTHDAASYSRSSIVEEKNTQKIHTFLILSNNNNEDLVRKILTTRKNWKEIKRGEGMPTLKWLAGEYGQNLFMKLHSTRLSKRILNQFQGHGQITTKNGLIRNLQFYTETKKIELFSITPITFLIDFQDEFCEYNLKQFLNFFLKNSPKQPHPSKHSVYNKVHGFIQKFGEYMTTRNSQLKKKINPLSKPVMSPQYIKDDSYIWLLKPTGLNRGRGIQIFNTLEELEKSLIRYLEMAGKKRLLESVISHSHKKDKKQIAEKSTADKLTDRDEVLSQPQQTKKSPAEGFVLRDCSFVIQKYIEKPLLISGRKFDIRVWALLNYDMSVYFFKQGYLRMSSQQYSTTDINNYFIHLTNNAVQKYSKEYGQFQNGNQISFATFRRIIAERQTEDKFSEIIDRIKEYTYVSLSSVKSKVNPRQSRYCFQIFGFDYILDETYKVWLIEVNNNPCIECSSPILKQYIPRMLDDAFKLVLDNLYKVGDKEREEFPVEGYSNSINMWEKLGRLLPNSTYKS